MSKGKHSRRTRAISARKVRCADLPPKLKEEFDYSGLSSEFLQLAKPGQRALISNGIRTPMELSRRSWEEVRTFHGIGKNALITLKKILRERGLDFTASGSVGNQD